MELSLRFMHQQTQNLPPIQRGTAGGDFTPSEGVVIGRLRRPGGPGSPGRDKRGQGHHMVPLPPLDSPKPSFSPRLPAVARRKREKRGLGSVRRADFGTLLCPEFTLREAPRITVRGHPVQGAYIPLRKAPLRSRVCPWSTRRPCGPLAFRRATEGSRVQRKGWGVKRGKKTLVDFPLLPSAVGTAYPLSVGTDNPPPPGGGNPHAMSWRISPVPGGPLSPAAASRRNGGTAYPLLRVRKEGSCFRRKAKTSRFPGRFSISM